MFQDRIHAGVELAKKLQQYRNNPEAVVVALPRGGVPVGYEVAERLGLPLDIVCPRKIGAPHNPEFAIGAITETGEGLLNEEIIERIGVSKEFLQEAIEKETQVAKRRLQEYRLGLGKRDFMGKIILLVDDGLATGSTMKAAIVSLRAEGAKKIIAAVPVSAPDTAEQIEELADELVCLSTPSFFQAVGQFYENFSQTSDEEVIALLKARSLP